MNWPVVRRLPRLPRNAAVRLHFKWAFDALSTDLLSRTHVTSLAFVLLFIMICALFCLVFANILLVMQWRASTSGRFRDLKPETQVALSAF